MANFDLMKKRASYHYIQKLFPYRRCTQNRRKKLLPYAGISRQVQRSGLTFFNLFSSLANVYDILFSYLLHLTYPHTNMRDIVCQSSLISSIRHSFFTMILFTDSSMDAGSISPDLAAAITASDADLKSTGINIRSAPALTASTTA